MESKKTTVKTSGSYKKSGAANFDLENNPTKIPKSGTSDGANENNTLSDQAIAAEKLFATIKETLHGETDRKIEDFKFCDWAVPEPSKKDHCKPVKCNDVIVIE